MIIAGLKITATSMVLEDAGLLFGISSVNSGAIQKMPAILFCMAGVLVIDSVLFFLARNLILPEKIQKLSDKVKLKIQVSKYKNNFIFVSIVLSRFTPGLRYPTVIAAGQLEAPVLKFFCLNAFAVLVWDSLFIFTGLGILDSLSFRFN